MNQITTKMALEVASHEAIIRQAYIDSEGNWTWSAGLTSATGHNVERYIDNPQPIRKCLEIYLWALADYNDQVTAAFGDVMLTDNQRTAALSFHWNTGDINGAFWVQSFLDGDTDKARKQFMNYSKPKSIIGRRKKERDLFFDNKWSNNGKMAEYARLRKNYTPIWASRVEIDVADIIENILHPVPDHVKEDNADSGGIFRWLFG